MRVRRKFSPQARQVIEDIAQGENRNVGVLIATYGVLEPDQQQELEQRECRINTVAGDVITADMPVRSLASLGDLDFVRYVELSRPLYPEPGDAFDRDE